MDLVWEFTYEAELGEGIMPGNGPYGMRLVIPALGGWVKGDRIQGKVVGAGGDWVLIGPDGWGRLDVRGQIQTDDGAVLYMSYGGVMQITEKVMAAIATRGEETSFDDHYFRTTPRLETGDERYAWVNQTVFVARGRISADGVSYEVHRVT